MTTISSRRYTIAFRDAAQSGASLHRSALQDLLAAVRRKDAPFKVVNVDDISRLSRDLGDTWRLVFQDFAAAGVRVIGVADGVDSFDQNARLSVGMRGLINDAFLQDVRKKTHRGLEGRAIAGFHTGGRCYGYTTISEPNPADPEHPRYLVRVEEGQARVVRRIFTEYVAGVGLAKLANLLNTEKVPAPAGRGWSKAQLHSLLRNERYIGKIVWNQREWFKDPITRRRRYRSGPKSQWVTRDEPQLAILDRAVWDAAQARHGTARRGGQTNGKKKTRLLSGLLRCGACGASMSIVSSRTDGRERWSQHGCSAHYAKGAAICPNGKTVSEALAVEHALKGVQEWVRSPDFKRWVEEGVRDSNRARARPVDDEGERLRAEIREQESKAKKAGLAYVAAPSSDVLKGILIEEEDRLRALRRLLADREASRTNVRRLPVDPDRVARAFTEIEKLVATDPAAAREALAGYLEPIVLRVVDDGGEQVYEADVTLKKNMAALASGHVVDEASCGGRI